MIILVMFSAGALAITSGFTNGVGQIWLDNVVCIGNETSLSDCPHQGEGIHNCGHTEDAGVSCSQSESIGKRRFDMRHISLKAVFVTLVICIS